MKLKLKTGKLLNKENRENSKSEKKKRRKIKSRFKLMLETNIYLSLLKLVSLEYHNVIKLKQINNRRVHK